MYQEKILMILPSRGRPHNVREVIKGFNRTHSGCAELIVCVDENDPLLNEYEKIVKNNDFVSLYINYNNNYISGIINEVAMLEVDNYYSLGFMGDDHRFRTKKWDQDFITSLKSTGYCGISYGDDLFPYNDLPTHVVMTSNIVKELGYMVPPNLKHMYLDNFWKDLGNSLNILTFNENIVVEHLHHSVGKSQNDSNYTRVQSLMGPDNKEYSKYKMTQFRKDIRKIRDYIESFNNGQ